MSKRRSSREFVIPGKSVGEARGLSEMSKRRSSR